MIIGIKVPRARFLPVKKTQDLLALMSDIYEMDDCCNIRLRINRPIVHQPIIKLSKHFDSMEQFWKRFATIPQMSDLVRLRVDGDVYFGKDVILKVTLIY